MKLPGSGGAGGLLASAPLPPSAGGRAGGVCHVIRLLLLLAADVLALVLAGSSCVLSRPCPWPLHAKAATGQGEQSAAARTR